MSNMRECMDKYRHFCKARIPFVALDTIEVSRALEIIKAVSEELGLSGVYVHSISKGMYDINSEREMDDDKSLPGALNYISDQMNRREQLTFVLTEASGLEDENADTRQLLGVVNQAVEKGGMVVAITSGSIWSTLQRAGMKLVLDFPDEREM